MSLLSDQGRAGDAPARALLSAVVLQAIADLDDKDEMVVFEANEFFLSKKGSWADMRRFYFGALGLDEARALRALAPKLTAPERPAKRWVAEDLFAVLPRVPFTAKEMVRLTQTGYTQVRARLQTLEDWGWVVKTARAEFCRADCIPAAPPPPPPPKPPKPPSHNDVKRLVYSLLVEPKTFKGLIIATNGDVSDSVIRDVLRKGLVASELTRADDGRYLLSGASLPDTPVEQAAA